jgi:hypothetical protein
VDEFPLGAVMNKALTLRGAQQHGHRYIAEILERMSRDEVKTEHLATHVMPLDDGPKGYRMSEDKEDGCVRAVFRPGAGGADARGALRPDEQRCPGRAQCPTSAVHGCRAERQVREADLTTAGQE